VHGIAHAIEGDGTTGNLSNYLPRPTEAINTKLAEDAIKKESYS
jgi:hypothetical protein